MNKLDQEIKEYCQALYFAGGIGDRAFIEQSKEDFKALFSSRLSTLEKRVEELIQVKVSTSRTDKTYLINRESVLEIIREMRGE